MRRERGREREGGREREEGRKYCGQEATLIIITCIALVVMVSPYEY